MAKEINPELAGDVGFGIETIDLDSAFDQVPEILYDNENPVKGFKNTIMIALLALVGIIVTGGLIFFLRKRKK